ncbi:MAG: molybdopterin-dependent oxidoreductase [Paracoccaceae bacterium]
MQQPNDLTFNISGSDRSVSVLPGRRLSEVLREDLGLKSVKVGCDAGDCGACTVLIDGYQHCACLVPAQQAQGCRIETLETPTSELSSKLQRAFLNFGAAQCGICTPGMMMAAIELLRQHPQPSEAQVKQALSGVLCRCTGYQKIIDAVRATECDSPEALKPKAGHSVGVSIPRLDGGPKVDGSEVFGADFQPEGTLLVRAVRSPYFHASFVIGNLPEWAKRYPKLETVLTAEDIRGSNKFGVIPALADQPALADRRVRYLGEPVALIVGPSDVVEAVDLSTFPIEWAELPHTLTQTEAGQSDAPQLHEDRPENTLIRGKVVSGDVQSALDNAYHTVHGEFETAYVEHAYIEPEAGIAWMDDDTLCIQACTQAPVMDQEDTAKVLGLPKDKVRILPAAAGGGFGAKLDLSVQPLIGLAALKTQKPCRMVYSRNESMRSSTKRHPGTMFATIGADQTGKITAMKFHGDFNTGAYASWGPTVATRVPVHACGPYLTPNYHATSRAIHSNGPTSGAFRGFGVPQAAIVQESLYDDLAEKCGMDRLAFRRQNALRDTDKTPCGQTLTGVGMVECFDALMPHWDRALSDAVKFNVGNDALKRGVGIAGCWYGCGNTALPNPSTIRIGIKLDGTIWLHQGATDIGQGSNTVISQIAADALGVGVEKIHIVGPDTALTPDCGKTSASRQTFITGRAALAAGQTLRRLILRMTNLPQEAQIETKNLCIDVTYGSIVRSINLLDLNQDAQGYVLLAEETYDPPTTALDENGQGRPYAVYGYGAQIAEVEVDLKLGTTRVLHMTAAHDLGRVINPMLAEGQIEGGIAQGLGLALMEEFIPGRTENLHDYLIPTIGDMPKVTSILIEKPDPEGPLGAKGLGEHVLIPTAPAILNAIKHASRARITRLPALPHRVLKAIQDICHEQN